MKSFSCYLIFFLGFLATTQVSSVTFTNLNCNGGSKCPFQVDSMNFEGYNLKAKGVNMENYPLPGGEVKFNVQLNFFGSWIVVKEILEPTCSKEGMNCDSNGNLVGANSEKSFSMNIAEEKQPPSGQYKGNALFYYVNSPDSAQIQYANVDMQWVCDNSKCT